MTGRWLIRQVAVLLAVAAFVTACTDAEPADPPKITNSPTASTPPETPSSSQPGGGVPKRPPITRPLDASAYFDENKICDLLTEAQAREFGFDGFIASAESQSGARCGRHTSAGSQPIITLTTRFSAGDALQGVYSGQEGSPEEWRPTVIVGQPAALVTQQKDMTCRVIIGIADRQGVEVSIFASDETVQRCDLAVPIAETIVHNLGG